MKVELPGIPVRNRAGNIVAWARVDPEDFDRLFNFNWHLCQGYARRGGGGFRTMHREVLGLDADDSRQVDHRNRDRLDNRKGNLRLATTAENSQNCGPRSGRFRGVTLEKKTGKWRATYHHWNGGGSARRQVHIGRFETEEEAAAAAAAYRAEHAPFAIEGAG